MTEYPIKKIVQVPLVEILKRVKGSVDFTYTPFDEDVETQPFVYRTLDQMWDKWLRRKSRDTSFWPLVDTLLAEGFKIPVQIEIDEFTGEWSMGDGHHRIAAAIMLVIDEIPVYFIRGDDLHKLEAYDFTHPDGTTPESARAEEIGWRSFADECYRDHNLLWS